MKVVQTVIFIKRCQCSDETLLVFRRNALGVSPKRFECSA